MKPRLMRRERKEKKGFFIKITSRLFTSGGFLKSIFDVENVRSAFKTTFKRREDKLRTYIILLGKLSSRAVRF